MNQKVRNREIVYMWHLLSFINMVYLQNKSNKLYILRFKKWDFVIEYTGEVIRNALADYRELTYNEQGFGDCYMFRASKNTVIDATFKGSEARFLNHSC